MFQLLSLEKKLTYNLLSVPISGIIFVIEHASKRGLRQDLKAAKVLGPLKACLKSLEAYLNCI